MYSNDFFKRLLFVLQKCPAVCFIIICFILIHTSLLAPSPTHLYASYIYVFIILPCHHHCALYLSLHSEVITMITI